jgi:glutathione S-transferase
MKLYNSIGPNPHVVRMFAAERGVELDTVEVDIMGGENRQAEYVAKNPGGQLPCLELDDGRYLSEITAICEYLDERADGPRLLGTTPEDRAINRMWARRVDLYICEPMATGFRCGEGRQMFESRMTLLPAEVSGDLKALAQEKLTWLDGLMAGNTFIGGDALSLADVLLYCFLTFGTAVGQPLNENNRNVMAWYERMKARPSAAA